MDNESFVFYKSIFNAVEIIPDLETKAQAYKAIALYGLCGIEPPADTSPFIQIIFAQAKIVMDNARNRYNACVENGKKGGAPKGNKNAKKKQPKTTKEQPEKQPKNNLNVNDNVNVNNNVNIKERSNKREKETKFLKSLSQKFNQLKINVENIDLDKYDTEKIIQAISDSKFLQNAMLSFILENYQKVINGRYADIKIKKESGFQTHNYTKEQLNNVFEDINNIDDTDI